MEEQGTDLVENRIVAVADTSLRVVLADLAFAELLGTTEPLAGRRLQDLPGVQTNVARLFDLLLSRVAGEVVVGMVGDRMMVAQVAAPETPHGKSWILLSLRSVLPVTPDARQRRTFVGRGEQVDAFERFLLGPDGAILVVEGPVGIGKSALLSIFEQHCQSLACPVFVVDARTTNLEGGFVDALAPAVSGDRRWVLLVDDFDVAGRNAGFASRDPLRGIPRSCRIVVTTRSRTTALATIGPRYRTLFIRLGPLPREDARDLAAVLGIEPGPLFERADGHPLSLHALAHGPTVDSSATERLVLSGDLPIARDLLEVTALPPRITEDVLFALLDDEHLASKTYDALGALCYPDPENFGLRMPEVFRAVLSLQLRRRNPARHASLRLRLARHTLRRLEEADPSAATSLVDDLLAVFEEEAATDALFGPRASVFQARRLPTERSILLRAFFERAPSSDADSTIARMEEGIPTYVVEEQDGRELLGVMQFAVVTPGDPASLGDRRRASIRAIVPRFATGSEARVGALLAFAVAEDGWKEGSQALARQFLKLVVGSRRLTALATAVDGPAARLALPGAETVEIDDLRLRLRDLRQVSLVELLLSLLQSDDDGWNVPEARSSLPPPIPVDAVRSALSSLDQPGVLRSSALAWLVADGDPARLRTLLVEAIDALRGGEDARQHEILKAIYLERRGKHELIAAELAMPYSTFRRHLTRGIERVREVLSERASAGFFGSSLG